MHAVTSNPDSDDEVRGYGMQDCSEHDLEGVAGELCLKTMCK